MAEVFFSYSHADEELRDQLEKQLAMLRRQGAIAVWHDRRIGAGQELHRAIDEHLQQADVILLLVSPDFLASDYCYEREMIRAMERHEEGSAIVIPVILRACDWHGAPFGNFLAVPRDGRPVTQWPDRDQAFLEITNGIKEALKRLGQLGSEPIVAVDVEDKVVTPVAVVPRSSNLRMAKIFTDRDKDVFRHEAFDFIAKYFENSLRELAARNSGIETNYRRVDANRFTSAVYKGGKAVARCTIFMGGGQFVDGIAYIGSETNESNSYNECLTVSSDELALFLRSSGMARFGTERDTKLSMEGGAEFYWTILMERLQH